MSVTSYFRRPNLASIGRPYRWPTAVTHCNVTCCVYGHLYAVVYGGR